MWNIFGDTDEITFGGAAAPSPRSDRETPSRPAPSRSQDHREPARPRDRERAPSPRPPAREYTPRPTQRPQTPFAAPVATSPSANLQSLIDSMKPTYLPPLSPDTLRFVALSSPEVEDPLMLVRSGDTTLLIGTGFSTLSNAGKTYSTFPDLRLIQSERDRLAGWILLETGFDGNSFQMILEMLGFPFVYGTRDVIAYIRNTIKDTDFLDKCRFFEIFSPGVDDRKIADFTLKNTPTWLSIGVSGRGFVDGVHSADTTALESTSFPLLEKSTSGYSFASESVAFVSGEIIDISGSKLSKNQLKFTFDTFYLDELSIGVVAGYALKDREELGSNGVLTFVLEEDAQARAIVGHIFIDSRGFVHAYEMMSVHKQILKGIRHIYEEAITANHRIERGELVQILRRELTKYCYLITGRTPVVMPIIIER